jgi:hypothetical protein
MDTLGRSSIDVRRLKPQAISAAISVALVCAIGSASARADFDAVDGQKIRLANASLAHQPRIDASDEQAAMGVNGPTHPTTTYEVTSCADDGSPGTLRYVIDHAGDGDTADLNNLTCGTITLSTGEIQIPQNNFTLSSGSGHAITIDAHGASRVIEHDGTGVLGLVRLNLTNGYFKYNSGNAVAKGGCILSNGPIGMTTTTISGCGAVNVNGQADGGAVYTLGSLNALASSSISGSTASGIQALGGGAFSVGSMYLDESSVTENRAFSSGSSANSFAAGGGIFADHVRIVQSSVSSNQAEADGGVAIGGGIDASAGVYLSFSAVSGNTAVSPTSSAGGVSATGSSYIYYSTLDHNQSVNNAALVLGGTSGNITLIGNSTISTNTATSGSSAVFASIPLSVNNSTIAFNVAAGNSAGLYLYPGGAADIESTIMSNNTSSAGGGFDLVARDAVNGSHNLIQNPGSAVPGDTITGVDPQLEPLASNFNLNAPLTHALASTSPAIDRGSNPRNFNFDERGAFNARVFGITADIGAYEWDGVDTDTIFQNGFD